VLGDVCEEVREVVSPGSIDPDTPYIGLEHIPRRSISLNEWGRTEQVTSSKHRFREGEILFGKIRPYFHKVGVAFVDGVASSDAIVIRPLDLKVHGLVLMTVSSDPFVAVTAQTMREGSKMPRADWKQMREYPVPLPPEGLLGSFESQIQSIVEQLKTLSFANHKLRTARDLLLPRLMSGEILA
jgi:type I restriction enzyme S subunit